MPYHESGFKHIVTAVYSTYLKERKTGKRDAGKKSLSVKWQDSTWWEIKFLSPFSFMGKEILYIHDYNNNMILTKVSFTVEN